MQEVMRRRPISIKILTFIFKNKNRHVAKTLSSNMIIEAGMDNKNG